jgi:pimeloyl-ACP methyl ester carboxylesterase
MEGVSMICRVIGVWSAIIVAFGFVSFSTAKVEARSCEPLFDVQRDLGLKVSVDLRTKQNRAQGFVKVREDRELYIDFLKPAAGKPIVVLLNGLTYRVGIWDQFVAELKGEGLGILRYDPIGMGETMKKYGLPRHTIEIADQVTDLLALLNKLDIKDPVHMAGLSYGGGMAIMFGALHANRVASLILEAPFTGPLPGIEKDIESKIRTTRSLYPWNPSTDAELYSYFLKLVVFGQYPLTEPIVLEHPLKLENVFRMTEGTKHFRAADFAGRLPKGKVHLMVADKDQYIPPQILEDFWDSIPMKSRASRLFFEHSEHKIPEAFPKFSASWIKLIIAGDKRIQNGETWNGGTWAGGASSGSTKIEIK